MDISMRKPFIHQEEEDFFDGIPIKKKRSYSLVVRIAGVVLCLVVICMTWFLFTRSHILLTSPLSWFSTRNGLHKQDEKDIDSFESFTKRYGRDYGMVEVFSRFRTYKENMLKAAELCEQNTALYGENEFADWTDEEFKQILLPVNKAANSTRAIWHQLSESLPNEQVPDHFDWRPFNVVTPVKSQFKCGSCWAFATVGTVESSHAVGSGELLELSEQQLLDCDMDDNACQGGHVDSALRYVYENGLMTEYDYPYVAHRQDTCHLGGHTTHIKSAVFIHPEENSMIDWLLHYGPVNVVINVTADMKLYKGGVYTPDPWECENKIIGLHALNIVGYGSDERQQPYWIIKNSWGQAYGVEGGYVYFMRGTNACGIEEQPMGVIA